MKISDLRPGDMIVYIDSETGAPAVNSIVIASHAIAVDHELYKDDKERTKITEYFSWYDKDNYSVNDFFQMYGPVSDITYISDAAPYDITFSDETVRIYRGGSLIYEGKG
jgi:hypothetical protein